jgi:hypothetical protein
MSTGIRRRIGSLSSEDLRLIERSVLDALALS